MSTAEAESINVTFDNILAEHLAAARLYYKSTFMAKADKVVACGLVLFGLLGTALVGVRWWTVVWLPLGIVEWFNLLSLRPLQIRWWFKRNPKFRETYHIRFGHNGIHFYTPSFDSRLAWDLYSRVIEGDRLWLLVYGTSMYTLIPKRAFASEEQQATFKRLIGEHICGRRGPGA